MILFAEVGFCKSTPFISENLLCLECTVAALETATKSRSRSLCSDAKLQLTDVIREKKERQIKCLYSKYLSLAVVDQS